MGKDDDEIDLLELFRLFSARKIRILTITMLATLIGIAIAVLTTPVYKADALLQLEEKSSGGMALSADLSGLFSDSPQSVAEIEILSSRMILGEVITALQLDISAMPKQLPIIGNFLTRYQFPNPEFSFLESYAWHGEDIRVAFLEVPEDLLGEPIRLTYLGNGEFVVSLSDEIMLEGREGEALRRPDLRFALLVDRIQGAPRTEFILKKDRISKTLTQLREAYSISERGKNSSILQLTMLDTDPARAARILEKVSEVYLLQNMNRNAAEAENSLTFIQNQLPEAEANMRAAESAVNAFQLSQDSIDLSFETRALLEQSVEIEAQLNQLALEEQELQKRFTRAHPAYQTLLDNRAQLTKHLDELRGQSVNLPETQLEMLRLTQNLEVTREIYLQLVNRSQELSVIKAGTIGNIRVIDSPMAFPKPERPDKLMLVVISTVLGFIFAIGYTVIMSFINRGVESQEALEEIGLSVYGAVQKIGNGEYGGSAKRNGQRPILANRDPTSLSVEALRSLRTSLHFGMLDAKSSILLMTSSRPGEGKSFISVNLATVMAQAGQNICLVDADIRRGYLRHYFGVGKTEPGLTDVLAGEVKIEDVIRKDPESGLHFIPAGSYPPNPSELFMHENFAQVCDYLDKRFDMTLMDAPPILAVTDPVIIGKYAGMMLLVVRHMFTNINEVSASLKTLENNGLKVSGAVLNAYEPSKHSKGASDYSYQYEYKSRA